MPETFILSVFCENCKQRAVLELPWGAVWRDGERDAQPSGYEGPDRWMNVPETEKEIKMPVTGKVFHSISCPNCGATHHLRSGGTASVQR